MYYLSTSCLVIFFLFFLFHHLACASSKQELGLCKPLFQCGNITAGFPFSGGDRPKVCGHPLLELHCINNIASFSISNQEFYVLHINQTSNTLTLARTDLLGSFCSSTFTNATLPPEIFEVLPNYKSLTVFYHCDPFVPTLWSSKCPRIGPNSVSENPKHRELCLPSFTVNVPTSFVPEKKELNMTNLDSVLRRGFEVELKIDANACQSCLLSHERCGFNESLPLEVKCVPHHVPTDLSTAAITGIKAGAYIGVILIITFLAQLICPKKSSDDRRQKNLNALIPLKHYSFADVKRITNSFTEVVGKGGFGTVYRGTLYDGRSVAVKILKDSKGNGEDFINEVASMSKTSHVNIVDLLGFCSDGSKRAIIYEFLENGSLDRFISRKTSMDMDWTTLYIIALGVARGLEYLHHGCKERIVHFDIKPHNILLGDNLSPKVSDFGLAKLCKKKESILSLLDTRGTIGYIAPEVFSRTYGQVSHKSDVYSYGMLVLEMIGARNKERVVQNSASNASSMYFPEWIYKDFEKAENGRLNGNAISTEDVEIAKKMTLVGLWCIQPSPSDRPPMDIVVEMMEGNLDALEIPPRPVFQIPQAPLQDSSTLSDDISFYTEDSIA